ncbi:putative Nudix hydrolase YvcI [Marinithermofilum abyssi]|uniref:Putative Nudix hydrolase YvcI n=1 Tax=Marinithermofilum abyssi TaxID=1571185 RepID=A0A8J2VCB5_9BACL|nr:8-oxo-dGTP diphosphatase [Marinithermofilum abyssi]GGE04224.1 putative Nudix hydrolase YvcI [Marinithermofilum abyssi]
MQRVANCILYNKGNVLLLQKPRRGWWVAPGGKMEPLETVLEAVIREFREETGLTLVQPQLRGIFTMCVKNGEQLVKEWMMFTFEARKYEGSLLSSSAEGKLGWHPLEAVSSLPSSPMDHAIFDHLLYLPGLFVGRLEYNEKEELLNISMHPPAVSSSLPS